MMSRFFTHNASRIVDNQRSGSRNIFTGIALCSYIGMYCTDANRRKNVEGIEETPKLIVDDADTNIQIN